jgi:membrane fusion protein
MYKVTVKLASSTVQAYGQPQPLRPGMQLEADIMQDSRRIFEWVLEPLYSISAKL